MDVKKFQENLSSSDTVSHVFNATLVKYPAIRDRYISTITKLICLSSPKFLKQNSGYDPHTRIFVIYFTLDNLLHGPRILYSLNGKVRFVDEYEYGMHICTFAFHHAGGIKMITTYDATSDTYSETTYDEKGTTTSFYRFRNCDGAYVY